MYSFSLIDRNYLLWSFFAIMIILIKRCFMDYQSIITIKTETPSYIWSTNQNITNSSYKVKIHCRWGPRPAQGQHWAWHWSAEARSLKNCPESLLLRLPPLKHSPPCSCSRPRTALNSKPLYLFLIPILQYFFLQKLRKYNFCISPNYGVKSNYASQSLIYLNRYTKPIWLDRKKYIEVKILKKNTR